MQQGRCGCHDRSAAGHEYGQPGEFSVYFYHNICLLLIIIIIATSDGILLFSPIQNEKLRHEMDPRGRGGAKQHKLMSSSPINAPRPQSTNNTSSNSLLSISPALVSFGSPSSSSPSATNGRGGASPKIMQATNGGTSNCSSSRWKPPILSPLPPSFLRISGCGSMAGGSRSGEQELPDEQFALMLQNEEFMNELRWNQVGLPSFVFEKIHITFICFLLGVHVGPGEGAAGSEGKGR